MPQSFSRRIKASAGAAPEAGTASIVALLFGLMLAASATVAAAQDIDAPPIPPDEPGRLESKVPDIENGNVLARKLCTSCHLIGEAPETPAVHADVPSFASIANRPNQSGDHLGNWLTAPHPPMPDINLTRMEIRDLTGFILSLRTKK